MGMSGMRLSPPQICLGLMVALITSAPFTGAIASAPEQGQAAVDRRRAGAATDPVRALEQLGEDQVVVGAVQAAASVVAERHHGAGHRSGPGAA